MTKLSCDVKIKSVQEDELSNMRVGFLIISCKPICEVGASIFTSSKLVLSLEHQLREFALRTPTTTTRNELQLATFSKFDCRFRMSELS